MTSLERDLNAELEKDFPDVRQPLKVSPRVAASADGKVNPIRFNDAAEGIRVQQEAPMTGNQQASQWKAEHEALQQGIRDQQTGYATATLPPPNRLQLIEFQLKRADQLIGQIRQLTTVIEDTNREAEKLLASIRSAL